MHTVSNMSWPDDALLILSSEMVSMNGQTVAQKDPKAILNACREVDRGIDSVEEKLSEFTRLLAKAEGATGDESKIHREIQSLAAETMAAYIALGDRIKKIKSDPESGNPRNAPQVGKLQRRLQGAIRQFQQIEMDYRNQMRAQNERDIRIARPDLTEAEVKEAAEDPDARQIYTTVVSTPWLRDPSDGLANFRSSWTVLDAIKRKQPWELTERDTKTFKKSKNR